MNQVSAIRTAAFVGLSLLVTGRVKQVQFARQVAVRPHGQFTREQIIKRSLPLCGVLTTDCDSLRLTCSPFIACTKGQDLPVWMVDGVDSHEKFMVHLVWNADSGELLIVSRPGSRLTEPQIGTTLRRNDALRIASSWLTTLGMSRAGSGSRTELTPSGYQRVWRIEWRANTRGTDVTIDASTGELVMAQTMRLSEAAERTNLARRNVLNSLRDL